MNFVQAGTGICVAHITRRSYAHPPICRIGSFNCSLFCTCHLDKNSTANNLRFSWAFLIKSREEKDIKISNRFYFYFIIRLSFHLFFSKPNIYLLQIHNNDNLSLPAFREKKKKRKVKKIHYLFEYRVLETIQLTLPATDRARVPWRSLHLNSSALGTTRMGTFVGCGGSLG